MAMLLQPFFVLNVMPVFFWIALGFVVIRQYRRMSKYERIKPEI